MLLVTTVSAYAHIGPKNPKKSSGQVENRAVCRPGKAEIDMDVNNVRARLRTGGDVWWDGSQGLYVVPKPAPGQPSVSSIFAGGVWVGGNDANGNLKLAGVTYRNLTDSYDWFPGPLDEKGQTDEPICKNWDNFFTVQGDEVRRFIASYDSPTFTCDSIPESVLYWPGQGNPYWNQKYDFPLPDQPLGAFYDNPDGTTVGYYDPCDGDFPTIEIKKCEPENRAKAKELIPDEMVFWIYNDNGGPHRLTAGDAIQMEVQVQAFAYATNDEINDMTFYRYKLINKADADIRDCYFAMWADPDLGCSSDDYVGCDVKRSLAYTYNEDALDGDDPGITCAGGVNTYGDRIPMVGTDYFRGPLGPKVFLRDKDGKLIWQKAVDENGKPKLNKDGIEYFEKILLEPKPETGDVDTLVELGMTSFIYTNRCGAGSTFDPATCDPEDRDQPFYNNLKGLWITGEPMTKGLTGYNPGSTDTVRYALSDAPNLATGWSMCTAKFGNGDRRTLQATGPLLLQPGAINELIIGAVWVPDVAHPCPDISKIQSADDTAQALFDNCFDITDGPDAPDITAIELDKQLILTLTNDEKISNNKFLEYIEQDLRTDNDTVKYRFEGYKVYQLLDAGVTGQELNDVAKARLILQTDIKNNISEIFNWKGELNPNGGTTGQPDVVWSFTRKVSGADKGLVSTFSVLEDQFAKTDRRLINHKQYHFLVLAYAHNNYLPFNPETAKGQRTAYLEGRNNIKTYSLTPRPIVYQNLNAAYGEGVKITRLSGQGSGSNYLDISKETREAIAKGSIADGRISYLDGAGPINVKIYNPLEIQDGKYRLDVKGSYDQTAKGCNFKNDAVYTVTDLKDNSIVASETSLKQLNEQIIYKKGFSVLMGQSEEPGVPKAKGQSNGAIAQNVEYTDSKGPVWFNAVFDGDNGLNQILGPTLSGLFDPIGTSKLDPENSYGKLGTGHFFPYALSRYLEGEIPLPFLSPASREVHPVALDATSGTLKLADLNNVDIVFTPNKDLWSRCIVVETASPSYYINSGYATIDGGKTLEVRDTPSVGKDGQPDASGTKGFSWFPGYAVDVETGQRLNIFFGENSVYRKYKVGTEVIDNVRFLDLLPGEKEDYCTDMIFNPSSRLISGVDANQNELPLIQVAGGQHNIYVTRQKYDECVQLAPKLKKGTSAFAKRDPIGSITWTCMPLSAASFPMKSIADGLIPNETTVKLRVNNSYNRERKLADINKFKTCDTEATNPSYEFEILGKQSTVLEKAEYAGALANVNVVPNPYYAYSAYETSQFTNVIKVTNLPERAIVTIYSLDGKFVKKFNREERPGVNAGTNPANKNSQANPDLEWDMKNFQGIPVASGVYLIHISAPELGEERTIKWFGINRKFDPTGL
jgi:hypothetical protein